MPEGADGYPLVNPSRGYGSDASQALTDIRRFVRTYDIVYI
jgi:hypothetical protein